MGSFSVHFRYILLVLDSFLYGKLSGRDDSVGILHGLREKLLVDSSLGMLGHCGETLSYGERSVGFTQLWRTQQTSEIVQFQNIMIRNTKTPKHQPGLQNTRRITSQPSYNRISIHTVFSPIRPKSLHFMGLLWGHRGFLSMSEIKFKLV